MAASEHAREHDVRAEGLGTGQGGEPPRRAVAGSRRAVEPADRLRDAERSRRALLAAALDEFSARGFSGARVAEIARRAGVNKQLINYYFGSKQGLYDALRDDWLEREAGFADPRLPFAELVLAYLRDTLDDPRRIRLMLRMGLDDPGAAGSQRSAAGRGAADPGAPDCDAPDCGAPDCGAPDADARDRGASDREADLAMVAGRQAIGEVASELDPAVLMLAAMALVAAPIALPRVAGELFGLDPAGDEFRQRYGDGLRSLLGRLAGQ
ncbi:MAG: TetR/AcrR family transcriptional regulator [Actinomycetia bacterium]|nr:TetR/AcrR family transcriptional regulator [Actinomycetes bacterium]